MYRVVGRLPFHSTGVGPVLLAHAPLAVQDEMPGRDLTLRPDNIVRTATELRGQLAAVRNEGVAVVKRFWPEPVISVTAPILSQSGPIAPPGGARPDDAEPAVLRQTIVAVDTRSRARQP